MKENHLAIGRRDLLLGVSALASTWALPGWAALPSKLQAQIALSKRGPALSPMLYGGFIEHIGNLINHSLWSEVLDDRKFYYGVITKPEIKPTDRRAAMGFIQKWIAVGPMNAISLETQAPFVGAHSPTVEVHKSKTRGIAQIELALAENKQYRCRLVVAGDPQVDLTVTLIWGNRKHERQSHNIKLQPDWTTHQMVFDQIQATNSGRIEITGKGRGRFRIGAASLMPTDNIRGFRSDTIALMKEMDCKILRMPGGNFVSAYDWKNTIGDLDKRPPIKDPVWNAVQPNDVGVDELLQLCQLIECEPYWCVNTGFGEPRSGAELLEYVNGSANTEWGAKRAENGHPAPYQVKYWAVGNEMYGHWQMGHMARKQYTLKHNLFVDAMRKVDPSIYIVAPGGFVDEMTTGQGIFIEGQPEVKVGSERDWAYGMFTDSWGKFDALGTHTYPPENKRFDLQTGKLFDVKQDLNEWARQPANRVRTMVDAWEEYKKVFPKLNEGKIKIYFDEWAYHFQDDLKGALAIALTFHEFYRHSDFIDMAGYTMATGWLDYDRTSSTISTRGRVFQLYQQHFGTIPLALDGNSPTPAPAYPIGGDQPRINAGSATYPLDISAALTADGKTLTVAIVNATESTHQLDLSFSKKPLASKGACWKFTGTTVDSRNKVGKPAEVVAMKEPFDTSQATLTIAPISVEIYHYPLA